MPSVRDLQSNGVVWDEEDEESYEQLNNEEIWFYWSSIL